MRPILIGAVLALSGVSLLGAPVAARAGEPPVKTVAKLDAKDPKYDTEACRAIRAKAIDYEEPGLLKKAVGMGGNAVVPFAGTVASAALGMKQNSKEDKLSQQVAAACVSDPLNEETPLINAPAVERKVEVSTPPPVIAAEPAVAEVAAPTVASSETIATSQ
jgi:hypothetical protein